MYQAPMSFQEKMSQQRALSPDHAAMIKKTYLLLGISVIAAMGGASFAVETPAIRNFFTGWVGWIAAMILLNALPAMAMALRHSGVLGIIALFLDGLVAGMVLGPLVHLADGLAPGIVTTAMIVTGVVFLSVSGFVMTSGRSFSAPRGLMIGLFLSMIVLTVINLALGLGVISLILSLVMGVFGVCALVFATSGVLNNPEADSPIPGALMLFSGLFSVFQAVLHLLLAFGSSDD